MVGGNCNGDEGYALLMLLVADEITVAIVALFCCCLDDRSKGENKI